MASPSLNAAATIVNVGGAQDNHKQWSDKSNAHWHESENALLINSTGVGLVLGDAVALSPSGDDAVVVSDVAGSYMRVVVAQGTIDAGGAGEFTRSGWTTVKAAGAIARGEYVRKSATAKAVETTGVVQAAGTPPPPSAIGIARAAAGGGFVSVDLFGVTIPAAPPGISYLYNGSAEVWGAGAAAAPTGWTLTGAGATVAKNTTVGQFKLGTASVSLTRVGADCYLAQNVAAIADYGPVAWWQGQVVSVGCWVRATVAARARLALNDGVGTAYSAYHSGGGAFEWLSVTRQLDGAATQVQVRLVVDTGNTAAQFDGATLTLGAYTARDWVPGSWRGRKSAVQCSMVGWAVGDSYWTIGTYSTIAEATAQQTMPFRCVVRNFYWRASENISTNSNLLRVAGGNTAVAAAFVGNASCSDLTHEVDVAAGALWCFYTDLSAGTPDLLACGFELEEVPTGI